MNNKSYFIDNFDTEILGACVAKLNLSDNLNLSNYQDFLVQNNIKLVVCFTELNQKKCNFLENNDYRLISTNTVYKLGDIIKTSKLKSDFKIETKVNPENLKEASFVNMINELAMTSHYSKNNLLPKTFYRDIYKQWVLNTFNGYADKYFLTIDDDYIVGFLSLKLRNNSFYIDLLAVSSQYRNMGIACALLSEAICYASEQKMDLLVDTQGENIAANRLYQKNGFLCTSFSLIYHKVIDESKNNF